MRPVPVLVLVLACAALGFVAACGPAEDTTEDDALVEDASTAPNDPKADAAGQAISPASFNPLSSSTSQTTAAKRYATNPQYVNVAGALGAIDRSTGARSYRWTATMRGDNNVYVDLAVSPGSVRILRHETRQMLTGQGSFTRSAVKVSPAQLAAKYPGQPIKSLQLSEPVTAHRVPHWYASFDNGTSVFVDAQTGAEQH